jgi:hypothetical protein
MQNYGFVEYRKTLKAYFAKEHDRNFDVVKSDIETEFDDISAQLDASKNPCVPGAMMIH